MLPSLILFTASGPRAAFERFPGRRLTVGRTTDGEKARRCGGATAFRAAVAVTRGAASRSADLGWLDRYDGEKLILRAFEGCKLCLDRD